MTELIFGLDGAAKYASVLVTNRGSTSLPAGIVRMRFLRGTSVLGSGETNLKAALAPGQQERVVVYFQVPDQPSVSCVEYALLVNGARTVAEERRCW